MKMSLLMMAVLTAILDCSGTLFRYAGVFINALVFLKQQ
jgi:hypothetical protein